MIVVIKVRDDGPLDRNLKAGDIISCYADGWSVGGFEKKYGKVAVSITDPVNSNGAAFPDAYLADLRISLAEQEFEVGPTPDANRVRRERKHGVPFYRQKFSPSELAIIDAGTETLPDGETSFGGTVLAGVISGLFSFTDIVRK